MSDRILEVLGRARGGSLTSPSGKSRRTCSDQAGGHQDCPSGSLCSLGGEGRLERAIYGLTDAKMDGAANLEEVGLESSLLTPLRFMEPSGLLGLSLC